MTARRHQPEFEALLREHQRIVYKVAAVYAHSVEDRDDLAQEICTQLWRSFSGFDAARGKFSTWMYQVALNVAISQVRRNASRHVHAHEPLQGHHLDSIAGAQGIDEPDPRLQALHALIGEMDAFNRALILLYLEDRSYGEIADILGISQTNVATKISRIKQTLRSQMSDAQPIGA